MRAAHEHAEIALAELWSAGACGIEEREDRFIVYAPDERGAEVRAAALAELGAEAVSAVAPVAERDWSESWKEGLRPLVVSPRLVVRSPSASHLLAAGQREVVIEPRQAFGTGAHASTALALAAIDRVLAARRVESALDVGCGSGVLALAALRLGARRAVAFDLDPPAAHEALDNAVRNGLGARLAVFRGTLAALGTEGFDLVVANLIRSELAPLLSGLVEHLRAGGALILSGLLRSEHAVLASELERLGARVIDARAERDERGDDWLALTATR